VTLTPGTHRSGITGLGGGVPEEPFGHAPTGFAEGEATDPGGGLRSQRGRSHATPCSNLEPMLVADPDTGSPRR
jgi:hypothetical protein